MRDRARRRDAHPAADRLHEPRRRRRYLRLLLDVWHLHRWEPDRRRTDAHGRLADVPLAQVAGRDDPPFLDIDVSAQLVGLAEPIARPQRIEIIDMIGWRLVVVG